MTQVTKLADILPTLPGHTQLWSLDVYRKAWQLLVDGSGSQETGSVCKTALRLKLIGYVLLRLVLIGYVLY